MKSRTLSVHGPLNQSAEGIACSPAHQKAALRQLSARIRLCQVARFALLEIRTETFGANKVEALAALRPWHCRTRVAHMLCMNLSQAP